MIKIVFSSFYNTLIDEEDAIPTSTMFELDRIKQKGIKFCILTNRLSDEVLYYNHDYPFIDYIISLNGSIIYDVNNDKEVLLKSFTNKELEEIEKIFNKKEILFYTKNNIYSNIPQDTVYKVEIKGTKKNNTKYYSSILKRGKESCLELTKNTTLDALKQLKVNQEEILGVIGNNSEELILDNIDNIYVVRNASKELKDKTDKITKSNKQKGFELVLKKEIK